MVRSGQTPSEARSGQTAGQLGSDGRSGRVRRAVRSSQRCLNSVLNIHSCLMNAYSDCVHSHTLEAVWSPRVVVCWVLCLGPHPVTVPRASPGGCVLGLTRWLEAVWSPRVVVCWVLCPGPHPRFLQIRLGPWSCDSFFQLAPHANSLDVQRSDGKLDNLFTKII